MTARNGKLWGAVGLLAVAGLFAGCDERQEREVRRDAREVGRQVGDTARDVGQTTQEAIEGFKEGVGGSGDVDEHQPVQAPENVRPRQTEPPIHQEENPRKK